MATQEQDGIPLAPLEDKEDNSSESQESQFENSADSDVILEDPAATAIQPGGYITLAIVTSLNLLNYSDRYLPSALKEDIKAAYNFTNSSGLTDAETGYQALVFLLVYMSCSPIFGTLSDRGVSRKLLITFGIICWSLASASAYFSYDFLSFLISRAFVGVGEASFVTITPSLLADLFPPNKRNLALTIFYSAVPVGAAGGYVLGGLLGSAFGWRMTFLVTGLPAAFAVFFIQDPGQGTFEKHSEESEGTCASWWEALKFFWKTKIFRIVIVGTVFTTFGLGAMADWIPAYIQRTTDAGPEFAGIVAGISSVVGGIAGTLLGGVLAQFLMKKEINNPYTLVSGLGVIIGTIFIGIGLFIKDIAIIGVLLTIGQTFLWMYNGPISTVLVNCMPPRFRTRAFGFQMIMIHLLGDAISPTIVGAVSTAVSPDPAIGITYAIIILPITVSLGGLIYLIGFFLYAEEGEFEEIVGSFVPVESESSSIEDDQRQPVDLSLSSSSSED